MNKVTWTTSGRVHATIDGKTTICGYDFSGGPENVHSVHGKLQREGRHQKRHCRTCFKKHADFKAPWLPACEP